MKMKQIVIILSCWYRILFGIMRMLLSEMVLSFVNHHIYIEIFFFIKYLERVKLLRLLLLLLRCARMTGFKHLVNSRPTLFWELRNQYIFQGQWKPLKIKRNEVITSLIFAGVTHALESMEIRKSQIWLREIHFNLTTLNKK